MSEPVAHSGGPEWPRPETCPRRAEGPGCEVTGFDSWRDDRTCSYCGSLHPDDAMKMMEGGELIEPTDKNYKVYLGAKHQKFYFPHLSVEQRKRLVELINESRLNFAVPGYFYVLPFFVTRGTPKAGA